MTLLRTLTAATIALGCLTGAAAASDASEAGNPGMLLFRNGTMMSVPMNSRMHAMITKYMKPYTGGMIYAQGGHLYTLENVKMEDGHLLYEKLSEMSPSSPNYQPDINH